MEKIFATEKIMEDAIMYMEEIYLPHDDESYYTGLKRQFKIADGFADIVGYNYEANTFGIFELKNETIKAGALAQILEYMSGFREILSSCEEPFCSANIRGYLVAPHCQITSAIKELSGKVDYVEIKAEPSLRKINYVSTESYAEKLKNQVESIDWEVSDTEVE